jgi:nitroreductase
MSADTPTSQLSVSDAVRTRRTHKLFAPEPVDAETLNELFDLARWAPNHRLTQPWRFRVVGPESLAKLKAAAGEPATGGKLDRAPTLVVASAIRHGDPLADEEDEHAAAIAAYIVLLEAHARGLASYWRTPEVLRTPEGRAAVSLPDGEKVLGLIHLGHPVRPQEPPERLPVADFATFLP